MPPVAPRHRTDTPAPPAIRRGRGKIIALTAAGLAVAALLLLIVFNIDRPSHQAAHPENDRLIELIPPTTLGANEQGGDFQSFRNRLHELGAENAWIQTTKNGKLSQQYRFASHDPSPAGLTAGWSRVYEPEIQMFLADNRVMTLQSDTALLRAPAQNIESGTMTGNVVIRLYNLTESMRFDPAVDVPAVEARTNEASFDNIQGEVRCEGHVDVQTATAHLPGSGLRVQINEVQKRIEWLRLEKVDFIRLSAVQESQSEHSKTQPAERAEEESKASPSPSSESSALQQEPQASIPQPSNESAAEPTRAPRLERERGQREGRGRRNRRAPQRTPPPSAEQPFYHLTLHQKVRVRQGDTSTGWHATGDELRIIFSMESRQLGRTLAHAPSSEQTSLRLANALSMLCLAGVSPQAFMFVSVQEEDETGLFEPADDDIIIHCDGGLTMHPLQNAAERPALREDARIELVGSPVLLHSYADAADIRCRTFLYHSLAQKVFLHGSPAHPLTIDSPQMRAAGERFWLDRLNYVGAFEEAGWLTLRDDESADSAAAEDLRVRWVTGVQLTFDQSSAQAHGRNSIGKLRTAEFAGDVEITSDEIVMRSDALTAQFPPGETNSAQRSIESIHAAGNVHAVSLADQGTLTSRTLDLQFASDEDGRTVPTRLLAQGDVAAVDAERQTIWSDELEALFASAPETEAVSRRAQVKHVAATGDVQTLMSDGARAFADRLDADAVTGDAVLTGDDVMVVSDRSIIHHGTRLELNKETNGARWPGSGRFVSYSSEVIASANERIARPQLEQIDATNRVEMRAAWTEEMIFDGNANEGAGSLQLTGSVEAHSWPSTLEYNTMHSHAATLHFVRVDEAIGHQPSVINQNESRRPNAGRRQLRLFIAEGDAKLEGRTWLNEDHSDRPRVFYVAGPHVTYDDQTFEARVTGAGELLVRDERVEAEHAAPDESTPFSGKGATLFRWSDHLQMTRHQPQGAGATPVNELDGPALYDIAIIGDVEVRHMALDKSISTITAANLYATVERSAAAGAIGDGAPQADAPDRHSGRSSGSSLDLGGSMEIRRMRGEGGVYITSPTRTIDCFAFDYDYTTGIATMTAPPGGAVTVLTTGNPHPSRAEHVVWDMINDRITLTNPRGTAPR